MIDTLAIPLLIFFIIFLLVLILLRMGTQRATIEKEKNRILSITKKTVMTAESKSLFQTQRKSLIEKKLQKYFKKFNTETWLRTKLYQSGIQLSLFSVFLCELLFLLSLVFINNYFGFVSLYIGIAAAVAIVFIVNILVMNLLIKSRKKKVTAQLPIALDIILRAIRAGHSLEKVLPIVAREVPAPLGDEFARMCQQLDLSVPFETALHNIADRVGLRDFDFFAIALIIQRQSGGSLSEVLENIIYVLIRRQEIRSKMVALTAEARVTSYILAAIPLVVWAAITLLNPNYLDFFLRTSSGQKMLTFCVVMLLIEFGMMKWMMRFKIY